MAARTAAQRASDYHARRAGGLDAVLVDIDRELILAAGLMSDSDYDNPLAPYAINLSKGSPHVRFWGYRRHPCCAG